MSSETHSRPFFVSLVAGAAAGTTVDVVLFPLDTLKTRMQSQQGFVKAGGFRGVYNGLASAAAGSAPGAALFFSSYEFAKRHMHAHVSPDSKYAPLVHMSAAALGESIACLVRVPTENVKQKMQAGLYRTTRDTLRGIVRSQGLGGFYSGYLTTLFREVPFAFIQFPIYERLKKHWAEHQHQYALQQQQDPQQQQQQKQPRQSQTQGQTQSHSQSQSQPRQGFTAAEGSKLRTTPVAMVSGWQAALCGSVSGGIAAALTTPMDVVKTRIMLDVRGRGRGRDGGGGQGQAGGKAPQAGAETGVAGSDGSTGKSSTSSGSGKCTGTGTATATATATGADLRTTSTTPTQRPNAVRMLAQIYKQEGLARLFAGVGPRVLWISLGGSVFFGVYEQTCSLLLAQSTAKTATNATAAR